MKSLPRISVENPVLVGVLMVAVMIGGAYAGATLVREMFPESRPNQIAITTPYPGATPQEVEKGISERLEEAIKNIQYIDKVETTISEGLSQIMVSLTSDVKDLDAKVNEFKSAVDAIPRDELPLDAEETRVAKFEPRLPVISVTVFGDVDESSLKAVGRRFRDEVLLLPGVTDVEVGGIRKGELTVEVEPEKLVEYRLSLAQVAAAIRATNLDLPGGQIKTASGNVAVRTLGETDEAALIEATVLLSDGGRMVRVRDIGRVIDGFEDVEIEGRFNGKPAVDVTIYKTGAQDAVDIADKVKAYVAGKRHEPFDATWWTRLLNAFGRRTEVQRIHEQAWNEPFPAKVEIAVHSNLARYIEDRLSLLTRNGISGLALVFLSLLFFLNWRVAFWVMTGLVVAVCGTAILMHFMGVTLNLITMFGLIVVLGILVDDAIVVGENIFARVEMGEDPHVAAVKGAEEVLWPVVVAVTTTIAAFMPLLFIEGQIGDFFGVLPLVVMAALSISLLEALILLPSHLSEWLHPVRRTVIRAPRITRLQRIFATLRGEERRLLQDIIGRAYERLLRVAAQYRYVTIAAVVTAMIVCVGLIGGGVLKFVFLQKMDSETLLANLEMPVGTPTARTGEAMKKIEQAILNKERLPEVQNIFTLIGAQISADEGGAVLNSRSHLAQGIIELTPTDQRDRDSEAIIKDLREQFRSLPGVNSLRFSPMQGGPAGAEIQIEVTGANLDHIRFAAEALKGELKTYTGVFDVDDDFEEGRREIQITLLDSARTLGVSTQTLATEVRGAFYGLEARTLQRDREDVDIRVRFPESRRKRVYELESMRIATPGGMAPLSEIARLEEGAGYTSIRRINQRRCITVLADVDQDAGNADEVLAALAPTISRLERQFPGLKIQFGGRKLETRKSLGSLQRDFFIAIALIYILLAALFKSYLQPLVVLAAVPFGLIGAVIGHILMGFPLTVLSVIGLVALSGIVVNDSLIMVDFINRARRDGVPLFEAVIQSGRRRLRAILLTSITTILGLAPLMMETSFQARFLIPMAISLSFGLLFSTVLNLIIVPALYLILDDYLVVMRKLVRGEWEEPAAARSP